MEMLISEQVLELFNQRFGGNIASIIRSVSSFQTLVHSSNLHSVQTQKINISIFSAVGSSETFVNIFNITRHINPEKSRNSSVGIALGYGLDDRGSRVRFSAEAGNFSLHYHVQNGSGAQPASYPVGTRDSFPGVKAAGA
jgi:hypothetical protein